MINKIAFLILIGIFLSSCATKILMSDKVISDDIFRDSQLEIYINGISSAEIMALHKDFSKIYSMEQKEISKGFEKKNAVCVDVNEEEVLVPLYKRTLSILTLSFYPYEKQKEVQLNISYCYEKKRSVVIEKYVISRNYGLLLFLSSFMIFKDSEVEAFGFETSLKSGLSKLFAQQL